MFPHQLLLGVAGDLVHRGADVAKGSMDVGAIDDVGGVLHEVAELLARLAKLALRLLAIGDVLDGAFVEHDPAVVAADHPGVLVHVDDRSVTAAPGALQTAHFAVLLHQPLERGPIVGNVDGLAFQIARREFFERRIAE